MRRILVENAQAGSRTRSTFPHQLNFDNLLVNPAAQPEPAVGFTN
jgi:hypothetical protein